MIARPDGYPSPSLLGQIDANPAQKRIPLEKELRQRPPERLGLVDRMLRRQRIHGVLHRIGRQDVAIVAIRVGLVVLAFKPDRDREILEVVAVAVPRDFDEPDARFAVGRFSEHGVQPFAS